MKRKEAQRMVNNGHAAIIQTPMGLLDEDGLRHEILSVGLHEIGMRMVDPQIPASKKVLLLGKAQRMFTALERLRIKQMTTVKT